MQKATFPGKYMLQDLEEYKIEISFYQQQTEKSQLLIRWCEHLCFISNLSHCCKNICSISNIVSLISLMRPRGNGGCGKEGHLKKLFRSKDKFRRSHPFPLISHIPARFPFQEIRKLPDPFQVKIERFTN